MDSTGSSGITRPITKVSNNSPSRVSTTLTARCAAVRSIGWLKNANTETSPSNSDADFGVVQPLRLLVVGHLPGFVALDLGLADQLVQCGAEERGAPSLEVGQPGRIAVVGVVDKSAETAVRMRLHPDTAPHQDLEL